MATHKKKSVKNKKTHNSKEESPISVIQYNTDDQDLERLPVENGVIEWHRRLAWIYGLLAVTVLALGKNVSEAVNVSYMAPNSLPNALLTRVTATHQIVDLNITKLVATFLIVSALSQILEASRLSRTHQQKVAKIAGVGHSFSAAIMMTVIGLLGGISDVAVLFTLSAFVFSALLVTRYAALGEQRNRFTMCLSIFLWAIPTIVVTATALSTTALGGILLPGYLYGIYAVVAVILVGWQILIWRGKGERQVKWMTNEQLYMLIGFIAQASLAIQVYIGVLKA